MREGVQYERCKESRETVTNIWASTICGDNGSENHICPGLWVF